MNDGTERWLPIREWEGLYEASDLGRIRSLPRVVNNEWRNRPGRVLRPGPRGNGYLQVNLSVNGKAGAFSVHHLVLLAFVGPRPDGMEVRHLDGVKTNNALSNLTYGTSSENKYDNTRLGLWSQKPRPLKTHCPQGHPYDEKNTRHEKGGGRKCRKCDCERQKARYRERKGRAA